MSSIYIVQFKAPKSFGFGLTVCEKHIHLIQTVHVPNLPSPVIVRLRDNTHMVANQRLMRRRLLRWLMVIPTRLWDVPLDRSRRIVWNILPAILRRRGSTFRARRRTISGEVTKVPSCHCGAGFRYLNDLLRHPIIRTRLTRFIVQLKSLDFRGAISKQYIHLVQAVNIPDPTSSVIAGL